MAANSKIEWCDHTFNPWRGCTPVSPGCAHCYAAALSKRTGGPEYRSGAPRVRTSAANWKLPLRWNREGKYFGECRNCGRVGPDVKGERRCPACGYQSRYNERRPRVFCASLADWLDDEAPIEWLSDLLQLIHQTPNLDWLLLTKRPENFRDRLLSVSQTGDREDGLSIDQRRDPQNPDVDSNRSYGHCVACDWIEHNLAPKNVWIGTTVENQEMADQRIPRLLSIPARVRFLSVEPLLGPVDLKLDFERVIDLATSNTNPPRIHWVICGGESGPKARPMHTEWVRSLRDQCQDEGVPFLFKQWGEWSPFAPECAVKAEQCCRWITPAGDALEDGEPWNDEPMFRVGKKSAGRLLDGRQWNEFPEVKI